jgi:hypothetical protein
MSDRPYGYCPICGAPGISRERRPGGNDNCSKGHTYPSADCIDSPFPSGSYSLPKAAMPLEWEQIDGRHQRAKVPGGWVLKAFTDVQHDGMQVSWDWRIAMCYIPDPNHEWRPQ